jgi:nucleoside-diphosphate-sugar epimerase
MSKGRVLVTGAAGLVGQAVCSALGSSSIELLPIVRQGRDTQSGFSCDLTQPDALAAIEGQVMGIVHLAAAVPMAAEFPDTENVAALTRAMDANVLGLAQRIQCPVLYASSCGLYRKVSDLSKVEDLEEELDPCTPYLRAKYDGERMFLDYGNAVIMRISAPIGRGIRKTAIVSRFIDTLVRGGAIRILGSGARQQNFISVADIADFVSLALVGDSRGVFNVAARHPVSMRELAETVVAVMGAGHIEFADIPDPKEWERADYDTTKAERLLGWGAKQSLASMLVELKGEKFRQ